MQSSTPIMILRLAPCRLELRSERTSRNEIAQRISAHCKNTATVDFASESPSVLESNIPQQSNCIELGELRSRMPGLATPFLKSKLCNSGFRWVKNQDLNAGSVRTRSGVIPARWKLHRPSSCRWREEPGGSFRGTRV